MKPKWILIMAATLALSPVAKADVLLHFNVDTSSVAGTAGSFDLQFNPGAAVTQVATLQVAGFAGNGTLYGPPSLIGDVSGGPLPASVGFDNGAAFNDYFEGFTYGTQLSFDVTLSGPAVNVPDGTSTSGSAFAFSLYSDANGYVPFLTSDSTDGFAVIVNLNLDGTTTVQDYSQQATVTQANATPEPGSLALAGIGLAAALRRWKRKPTEGYC